MITNYRPYFILLIFSVTILHSCKSKKALQVSSDKKTISQVISPATDYRWIEAKAKINFKSTEYSTKGILSMRMRKDSAVLMAVKKIGVEGGRCLITQDSMTYIDRLSRNYKISALTEMESIVRMSSDYSYLEMLLSGATPVIDPEEIIDSSYHKNHIVIKTKINNIIHSLTYDIYTGHLKSVEYHDTFSSGTWSFSDYRLVDDAMTLPYKRTYVFQYGNNENLTLDLDFNKIEIDIPKTIQINIPPRYNRIY